MKGLGGQCADHRPGGYLLYYSHLEFAAATGDWSSRGDLGTVSTRERRGLLPSSPLRISPPGVAVNRTS